MTIETNPVYLDRKFDAAIFCKTCGHYGDWHSECNGSEVFGCEFKDCSCKCFETLAIDNYVQYDLNPDEIIEYNVNPKHLVRKTGQVLK